MIDAVVQFPTMSTSPVGIWWEDTDAAVQPSMIFRVETPDGHISCPYAVYMDGKPMVQVNFQWLARSDPRLVRRPQHSRPMSPRALPPTPSFPSRVRRGSPRTRSSPT